MQRHVVNNGDLVLTEDVTPAQADGWARDLYDRLGGAAFFARLATAFYAQVAQDPVLAPLFDGRPLEQHARRLARHFDRMYGRPDRTEAWEPRLLAAHTGFLISHDHRNRWLDALRAAGKLVDAPEPVFSDFVATMLIASGDMTAASRGAALARGERFNRAGEAVDR